MVDNLSDKNKNVRVKVSLKLYLSYWLEIGANDFILDTLQRGYKIPFKSTPMKESFRNNRSALENYEFVASELKDLLESGRILETTEHPYLVNPLTVSVKGAKKRLILDCSYLNEYIIQNKIKFDDWKSMLYFIEKDCFMFKFDITQGYHHIDICENFQCYFGFSWETEGVTRYFVFTVLPFGITSGPFIFTKVFRVLIKYWRQNHVKISVFLDDGLGCHNSYARAKVDAKFVRSSLEKAGFIINNEKSVWDPVANITWLGVSFDSTSGYFSISQKRVKALKEALRVMIDGLPKSSPRKVAAVCGKIISTKFVLGNIVSLKTRRLYELNKDFVSWDQNISFSSHQGAVQELFFWKNHFEKFNARFIQFEYRTPIKVYSDARSTGIGIHFHNGIERKIAKGNFTQNQSAESSTWREIFAIQFGLKSFSKFLKNKKVVWHTDNMAAKTIVKKGSSKSKLQDWSEKIFEFCYDNQIDLSILWVPRDCLTYADFLSKETDYNDWETSPKFFDFLNQKWGPFTIDCFADDSNTKVLRFYSRYHCPKTLGVNAFHYNWSGENVFLVPPIHLIPITIRQIQLCRCNGVLLVPYWPSAIFFPLLYENKSLKLFFKKVLFFDGTQSCFIPGKRAEELVGSIQNQSEVMALKIVF